MDYDFFGTPFLEDPFPTYRQLRENDPVYWSAPFNAWLISRYDDVNQLLVDERVTPDQKLWAGHAVVKQHAAEFPNVLWALDNTLLLCHGQRHAGLRTVARRPFDEAGCRHIASVSEAVVAEVIDGLAGKEEIELFTDFSAPVRIKVMSRLIGPRFTPEEEDYLVDGTNRALGFLEPSVDLEVLARHEVALGEFRRFVADVVDRGRANPDPHSMLGQLMNGADDGVLETREDVISLIFSFLLAGTEAIGSLITMGVLLLLEQAEQRDGLLADPEQGPALVREILRYRSFTKFLPRYVVEDFELRGQRLQRGEVALLLFQSALRDPEAFANPDTFDVGRRDGHKGFAFGRGIHHCVGQRFAEVEGAVALRAFFRRFPRARLRDQRAHWVHHHMMVAVPPTLPMVPILLH